MPLALMLMLAVAAPCLATPSQDPLDQALARFAALDAYRTTLRSGEGKKAETIRYFYKKPGYVRMEFVHPHKGAVLVYDPAAAKIRLRPFGLLKSFVLTLDPDDRLVTSAHGHRVDSSDIGSLLARVKLIRDHGGLTRIGEEALAGHKTLLVEVAASDSFALEGVHRYRLWLDETTLLPLKVVAYGLDGAVNDEVLMDDLTADAKLDDSLFRLGD